MSDNFRGTIYMIIGMACFMVGDMCVKLASQELPSGQVMIVLGLGSALVFGFMLARSGETMWSWAFFEGPVMFSRSVFTVLIWWGKNTIINDIHVFACFGCCGITRFVDGDTISPYW